jgi:hypothetical protein
MGKAQKKTGKGRLDKYYKLAKCVWLSILHTFMTDIPKRAGLPRPLGLQAHPTQQEICFSGVCALLY